jgi:O-methyltransferase
MKSLDYEGIDISFYKNDFLSWSKQDEINYNNNEIRQKAKYWFFQNVFDYLSANFVKGDYMEFGCHKARTFRMALSEARKKDFNFMNFYAFDSFEGLPEANEIDRFPGWEKGNLKTTQEFFTELTTQHGIYVDKIKQVKGYFNKSLNSNLKEEFKQKNTKIALAYIDSDFYESARDVLNFIEDFLQEGAVIAFDDWNIYKGNPNKGEKKAFREFREKSKWQFEEFMNYGWMGKSFIVY